MSTDLNIKTTSSEAPSIYAIQQGSAYLKVGDVGESVLVCRELLNKKGYACDTTSETYDTTLKSVVAKFQKAFGLTSDGLLGQASLAVLQDEISDTDWLLDGVVNITAGKLARMGFGKEVLKPASVSALNEACNRYHITSKTKVRHFLAQGLVETDNGKTFTEYIYVPGKAKEKYTNCKYAPYCGGGFMQLTWEENYKAFYNYMKDTRKVSDAEIITPAEYATQHVAKNYAFESAGWYWDVFKDLNTKITQWTSLSADETVTKVTKVVNGGTNGLQARKMHILNQKQYSNKQNRSPQIWDSLLYLYLLIAPLVLMSCQRGKHMPPHPMQTDSISTKVLLPKTRGEVFVKNSVTINDTIHLPQTNEIEVYKNGKKIQTIIYKYDWNSYGFPMDRDSIGKTELADVDFDGNKDLLIYKGAFGNQGIQYFDCYLWNKEKEKFKFFSSFGDIENPILNEAHRCIYSQSRENANCYIYKKYQFVNEILKVTAILTEKVVNHKVLYDLENCNKKKYSKILNKSELGEWADIVMLK